ncbi:MAG: 1-(5-phosphoribosyl)-5-[(5-phosphoribosylamino)methylideneamino]imidazole-4-carboxamide isomerase [Phycisphaeraceae bacterium]|nr:1-(5-phosphoribosyl)-5-[(5-phosphoribosylamino)methylideneamino]imidazole-4-carboxamide isomerase [Phycisphaeraceae bacterium]
MPPAPPTAAAARLFPAIDLRGGKVVRLTQGDYARQTTYGDDPLEQAQVFAQAGASWLHVVDLDGARSGEMTHAPHVRRICAETTLKVEVGGGVRSEQAIDLLLNCGVERVILGTAALRNWAWFEKLVQHKAYQRKLVLGLDARGGKVATDGWEKTSDVTALEIARRVSDWPLAAIVYTDIAVDGMLSGPNVAATRELAQATRVPIIASGGVGTLDHLRALRMLPIQGAIVGKALYENAFTIHEALAAFERGA